MRTRQLGVAGLLALLAAAPPVASPPALFDASIQALTPAERTAMTGRSWQEGCPVGLDDLVSIRLRHFGFDQTVHYGVLVVHRKLADETVRIFRELFEAGFPIEQMQPYETYPIGQYASHNDTVGFYCRPAQDDPDSFSFHAYGAALDINPLTNPYHDPKEGWWPPGSAANAPRDQAAPGKLTLRSDAVAILLRHGWAWGGSHPDAPDYMHFGKVTLGGGANPMQRPFWVDRLSLAPD